MLPFVPSLGAAPLDISDVEGPFVRLVLAVTIPAAGIASGVAFFSQDTGALVLATSTWFIVAVATAMITLGKENAVAVLGLSGTGMAAAAWVTAIAALQVFASLSVVFVGAAAVVFLQGRARGFLITYAFALFAVHFLWMGWSYPALVQGALTALAFLASSIGMRWIRDRSMDSASRFLNLFERAPVSLWEEDFSKVGVWLDGLRERGVTDLRGYLTENPIAFREGMGLIEVVRVNQAAARFLEVDDPEKTRFSLASTALGYGVSFSYDEFIEHEGTVMSAAFMIRNSMSRK